MTTQNFKFLFVTEPFYNAECENYLPSLEDTKLHFLAFLDEYFKLDAYMENEYANSMNNFEVFLGADGRYINVDTEKYNQLHSYFQTLRSYYKDILNACRRKYGFWLNDILPDKYKQPTKKAKKRAIA